MQLSMISLSIVAINKGVCSRCVFHLSCSAKKLVGERLISAESTQNTLSRSLRNSRQKIYGARVFDAASDLTIELLVE